MKAKLKKESDGDYILILNNPKEYPFYLPLLSLKNCQAIEQQFPTEKMWDVEIEMEDTFQLKKRAGGITNMGKPKLDADGCLILRTI